MSDTNNTRRDFLKFSGLAIGATVVAGKLLGPALASAAESPPSVAGPVKETDTLAVSLGYHEAAAKVDLKKWPKRAGAEGAKQFCYDCMFFQAKGDPKAEKRAPCTIFAGKTVNSKGWCNSWTQNPKVKA